MGLEITKLKREPHQPADYVVATQELYLTADKERIVLPGSAEARFLFCIPGDEVPVAEAERVGLISKPKAEKPADGDGKKEADKPDDKQAKPKANKAKAKPATKSKAKKG